MNVPYRSYQIHIRIKAETNIKVGKLGIFTFPAGSYIYTGSAKRNIKARVQRHQSTKKKLRWHIDYLLASRHAVIQRIELFDEEECHLNKRTDGTILINRFGAADCRHRCGSHLKYIGL